MWNVSSTQAVAVTTRVDASARQAKCTEKEEKTVKRGALRSTKLRGAEGAKLGLGRDWSGQRDRRKGRGN